MARFVTRRLIQMVLVMFAVSVLTFLIFNVIPNGDPAVRMAGRQPTETQIEAIRREWGFDENIFVQYFTTMKKVFTGDLQSYFTQLPVGEEILKGLPRTLSLAIGAAILWLLVAVAFGLYSAVKAGKFADRFLTIIALIGISMPVFWIGALMNHYLGFKLGWFPNGGYVEFTEDPVDWFYHLILPWTALAILFIGFYSRVLRSNVLDTINEDYVRTARAKGLGERQIMVRHVLRNSMIPIVTLWGLDFGAVLGGGAILTETVFDLQGVGQYAAEAVGQLDVPPVLATTMFAAFFIVLLNAVVGESGSGKSVSAMTLMGLTRSPNAMFEGTAHYKGTELIGASEDELRRVRGAEIAMIFQDPMTSLNPVHRIGRQIVEQIQEHEGVPDQQARERTVELLERVGIPRARERVDNYPFEFSGGMRQRVMIALALSCNPSVLIADEPTTALDVTIQAQILQRIRELREETGAAVMLVTHDLGVVADIADRIAVMYAGRIVEQGTLDQIFYDPQHPYTWGLLGSITRVDRPRPERLPAIAGLPPSLADRPEGCHFRPRCPHEFSECSKVPPLESRVEGQPDHLDRCWLPVDEKRSKREVLPGEIGLGAKEEVRT